ncbi:hypothetical protein GO755_06255 [Spirosoma sp. HMF4905]|uniref:Lipocalin-like domain-containing protein n=1 Tax=Spirosoma arboris TaxID=2682092 RepID=A0A7K1S732_9BACT|nr:hypothetical protein [Spirosoma arboris]MVM29627.1 hypothetical protein [Spirosoma arboris]
MKTTYVIALFAIISTLSACSKKSDDVMPAQTTTTPTTPTTTTTPTTPTQSTTQVAAGFQVKVDGYVYTPDLNYALTSSPADDTYYGIYGLDSKTGNLVALLLPKTVGEGTFPINTVNLGIMTVNQYDFSTRNGGTGTVTITKKTATNVIGTFSFTTYDASGTIKSTLTEGSFNVAFK